jgi:hypothetical protein
LSPIHRSRLAAIAAFALTATIARAALGCLEARHARSFVLGSSARGLVALELDLRRQGEDPRWVGPARIGVLSTPGAPLQDVRALASVDVTDNALEEAVRQRVGAGTEAARGFAGFRPAGLPRYTSCDFRRSCDRLSLGMEQGRAVLTIAGATSVRVPLSISPVLIADAYVPTSPEKFAAALGLVSVLSYDLGGREVLVVDVGSVRTGALGSPRQCGPPAAAPRSGAARPWR